MHAPHAPNLPHARHPRHALFASLASLAVALSAAAQSTSAPATPAATPPANTALTPAPAWTKFPMPKPVPIQVSSVKGTGPLPVVIISDLGPEPIAYEPFAERHAERFTTHTLAMPGTTKDAKGPQLHRGDVNDPEWLLNAVNAVAAYIRDNKLDKPVVLGHGIGGMAAYMLAITEPDLARSYIVVNMLPARGVGGPGRIPSREERNGEVDRLERASLMELKRNVWLNQVRDSVPTQCRDFKFADELVNQYSRVNVVAIRRYRLESLYLDLRDDLTNVKTPMLVIATIPDWFERLDRQVLAAAFQNVGYNRPNVTVEILDNMRGWGIIEEPDRFDPPMLKFLGLPVPEKAPEAKPESPAEKPTEKSVEKKDTP
jgi:pimeloyl-ACP methyl ester carboxylesterase